MAPLTYLEKQFSKQTITEAIELPTEPIEKVDIELSWDMIDKSTSNYADLLQEYDIAEVMKSLLQHFSRSKNVAIMPKPGNLDMKDDQVRFTEFYALLEALKTKWPKTKKGEIKSVPEEDLEKLREACGEIVKYMLTGSHKSKDKVFQGLKSGLVAAKRSKKTQFIGIISIDIPNAFETPRGSTKYKCSGTQHYVAYMFDTRINKLFIFDSASKHPLGDHSEIMYILKFVFEKLLGTNDFAIEGMRYRDTLQPGAGDRKEESEQSYNNQNVFCHTWSLWFSLVMMNFYETQNESTLKFLRSLSHRNPLLNLAMIKRFAGWLVHTFLDEETIEDRRKKAKFAIRAYNMAKEKADVKRLQKIVQDYSVAINPYMGLNYVWNYKTSSIVSVDRLCLRRKVKMDVDLLDKLDKININSYIEASKQIRCPVGYFLNESTKRCRLIRVGGGF